MKVKNLHWYHKMTSLQYPKVHQFRPWQQSTAVCGLQKEPVHEAHLHQSPLLFWNRESFSGKLVMVTTEISFYQSCLLWYQMCQIQEENWKSSRRKKNKHREDEKKACWKLNVNCISLIGSSDYNVFSSLLILIQMWIHRIVL